MHHSAIGAERPAKINQALTVSARLPQLGMTVGTEHEVIFNVPVATRTVGKLFKVLKQVLLFQRTLKSLIKRFFWSEEHIDQDTGYEEEDR
jgi:hypothetical protein